MNTSQKRIGCDEAGKLLAFNCQRIMNTEFGQINKDHLFEFILLLFIAFRLGIHYSSKSPDVVSRVMRTFDSILFKNLMNNDFLSSLNHRTAQYHAVLNKNIDTIMKGNTKPFNDEFVGMFEQFCNGGKPDGPIVLGSYYETRYIAPLAIMIFHTSFGCTVQYMNEMNIQ